jgi:hypothetical protein
VSGPIIWYSPRESPLYQRQRRGPRTPGLSLSAHLLPGCLAGHTIATLNVSSPPIGIIGAATTGPASIGRQCKYFPFKSDAGNLSIFIRLFYYRVATK